MHHRLFCVLVLVACGPDQDAVTPPPDGGSPGDLCSTAGPIDTLPAAERFSGGSGGPTARTQATFASGGRTVRYTSEAPAGAAAVGALIYFHGGRDPEEAYDALLPQIASAIAAPKKLVVVAVEPPNGDPERGWYTGLADNVALANALIDDVLAKYDIDKQRIFLTGVQSGGAFATAVQYLGGYRFRGGTIGLCGGSSPATIEGILGAPAPALPATTITADMRRGTRFYFADSRTVGIDSFLQFDASHLAGLGFPVMREFPSPPAETACGFDIVAELARAVQATDPLTAGDCANVHARPGIHELALGSAKAFAHPQRRVGLTTVIAPPQVPGTKYGLVLFFHGDGGAPVYAGLQFDILDDDLRPTPFGAFLAERDLVLAFMQAPGPEVDTIAAGTTYPPDSDHINVPIRTWSGALNSYEGVVPTNLADNRTYVVDVLEQQLAQLYDLDTSRIYFAGASGGGELASVLINPFEGYRFKGGSISLCGSLDPTNAEFVTPLPPDVAFSDDTRRGIRMFWAINSQDDLIEPTRLGFQYFSAPGRFTADQLSFNEFPPPVAQHCGFDDVRTPEVESITTFLQRGIEFVDPR
jgi:poly(3-hydroxybutyrate) depolymerase